MSTVNTHKSKYTLRSYDTKYKRKCKTFLRQHWRSICKNGSVGHNANNTHHFVYTYSTILVRLQYDNYTWFHRPFDGIHMCTYVPYSQKGWWGSNLLWWIGGLCVDPPPNYYLPNILLKKPDILHYVTYHRISTKKQGVTW